MQIESLQYIMSYYWKLNVDSNCSLVTTCFHKFPIQTLVFPFISTFGFHDIMDAEKGTPEKR